MAQMYRVRWCEKQDARHFDARKRVVGGVHLFAVELLVAVDELRHQPRDAQADHDRHQEVVVREPVSSGATDLESGIGAEKSS